VNITKVIKKSKNMRINEDVIKKLRKSNTARARVQYELNISPATMYRIMYANGKNSDLTKAGAVKVLSEELGVPEESILTE
jgi:hypothetical protein